MSGKITVREAVIQLMRDFGMDRVFGNPGSTELPMFRDYPDDFEYVLGLQESVVVGMADGYARATRNASMVNLHSAVGVGHAMGNIFTAFKNQTPMIITAGQQARAILPFEPFLYSAQATELPKPYVKWSCEPARAEDVPLAIARAYYTAMQAPRGPVLVSVPVDDWDQLCDPVPARVVSRGRQPDQALISRLASELDRARAPVIVVGPGTADNQAWDNAVALAERLDAPVWVSPMSSLGSFPETHPLFAGFLPAMREKILARIAHHDMILVLGAPVFTFHVEGDGPIVPEGSKLWQIINDPDIAAWSPLGNAIVSDVNPAISQLMQILGDRNSPITPVYQAAPRLAASDPMSPAFVLQTIADVRPENSIVVEESPSSRAAMHDYLPIIRPDTFYTCASGGLGYSLPAAVGISMARPDRRTIALIGDGSSLYSFQAIWNAAQSALPVTFIIMNNGRYQALHEFSSIFKLEPVGTSLPAIDYVGLASALGVRGERVERAAALVPALRNALDADGPSFVEILVS